jgi:hypothetical protein
MSWEAVASVMSFDYQSPVNPDQGKRAASWVVGRSPARPQSHPERRAALVPDVIADLRVAMRVHAAACYVPHAPFGEGGDA